MKWSNDPEGDPLSNKRYWIERAQGWAKDALAAKEEYGCCSSQLVAVCTENVYTCLRYHLDINHV